MGGSATEADCERCVEAGVAVRKAEERRDSKS